MKAYNSRKLIFSLVVVILQVFLYLFADLPAISYQAIIIATTVGYLGANAAQKFSHTDRPDELKHD